MEKMALWNYNLKLLSHVYWERKTYFKLDQDTYPTWVMFAVEEGGFEYQIGLESGVVEHDELIFCPPGYLFQRNACSPMKLHFTAFEFDKPLSKDDNVMQMPILRSQPTDRNRLASNFSYLRMHHLAMDLRSVLRKQWMLNDLWQLACNEWDTMPSQDDLALLTQTSDEPMKWAMKWLIGKAHIPFSMRELSSQVNLSPVQFTRRFQKSFRMTPSELVRTIRLRRIAKLLLDSELTLDQIAERCGYDNGFYLSRVFSQYMGMSPSNYREQNRV